jgi:3-deoxy-manno-octulosonate cytidylyltransferase (CMP-KDO synthetase)
MATVAIGCGLRDWATADGRVSRIRTGWARVTVLAVIPARYGASRFPGKMLADLGGRPVIQWVHDAARGCTAFDDVVVATDDERIASAARGFGANVEMTRDDHATGSDRVAEVAERRGDADVVANVQGDQPFATTEMLEALLSPYASGERPDMSTVATPLPDPAAADDPNSVKVVCDRAGYAMYFSRSRIPHFAEGGENPYLHHLGLYAFTRETVLRFPSLEPTPLERHERLEQLRALEHGIRIRVSHVPHPILEINTPEDLAKANEQIAGGSL